MKYVVGLLICLICFAGEDRVGREVRDGSFKVIQIPGEAYLNEPVTFVLQGKVGDVVTVELNKEVLANKAFTQNNMEINLKFQKSGVLSFRCGTRTRTCLLVMPSEDVSLSIRKGFLYAGEQPTILLLPHKYPPKHNRRWEVLDIVQSLLSDSRPVISKVAVVGGAGVEGRGAAELAAATATQSGFWLVPELEDTVFEIDSLVVASQSELEADALVVMFSGRDFARGMHPTRFRMRLEWALLRHSGFKQVFVVSLPLTRVERERSPQAERFLRLAAEANGAEYVSVNTLGTVFERLPGVVERMRAKVKF